MESYTANTTDFIIVHVANKVNLDVLPFPDSWTQIDTVNYAFIQNRKKSFKGLIKSSSHGSVPVGNGSFFLYLQAF